MESELLGVWRKQLGFSFTDVPFILLHNSALKNASSSSLHPIYCSLLGDILNPQAHFSEKPSERFSFNYSSVETHTSTEWNRILHVTKSTRGGFWSAWRSSGKTACLPVAGRSVPVHMPELTRWHWSTVQPCSAVTICLRMIACEKRQTRLILWIT